MFLSWQIKPSYYKKKFSENGNISIFVFLQIVTEPYFFFKVLGSSIISKDTKVICKPQSKEPSQLVVLI